MKKVIGITGSIACGKSYVSDFIYKLGFKIIDTDVISHELTKKGRKGYNEVIKYFPYLKNNNELDRKKLASVIFSSKEKRDLLNSILHPIILDECRKKILKTNDELIFIDVPLMFESGFNELCDKVICVFTNKDLQIERLMKRDNLTKEEALKRINSQMPIEEKMKLSDYTLESFEDYNKTNESILNVLRQIKGE